MYTIKNLPIQNQYSVQARTRPIHRRLVVMAKLGRKQRNRNTQHEDS